MKPFLYERLFRSLLEEMLSGHAADGAMFLSNRSIRRLWGVNQRTVDRSIGDLKTLGLLTARPRSGYRLADGYRERASILVQQLEAAPLPKVEGWDRRVRTLLARPAKTRRWTVLIDNERLWHERDWQPGASLMRNGSGRMVMTGFGREAARRKDRFDLLMVPVGKLTERMLEGHLARHRYDGAIFVRRTTDLHAFEVATRFLQKVSLPHLTVFEPFEELGTPCLRVNDRGLGFEAATRLLPTGAERFVILVNPLLPVFHEERINGARQALARAGVDPGAVMVCRMAGDPRKPIPRELLHLLRDARQTATGMLVLNNELFFRLEPEIARLGLRIPEQLSIITCGGGVQAPLLCQELSLMEIDFEEIGAIACRRISELAEGVFHHGRWIVTSRFRRGHSTANRGPGGSP